LRKSATAVGVLSSVRCLARTLLRKSYELIFLNDAPPELEVNRLAFEIVLRFFMGIIII
jgi:hypothetical protein